MYYYNSHDTADYIACDQLIIVKMQTNEQDQNRSRQNLRTLSSCYLFPPTPISIQQLYRYT